MNKYFLLGAVLIKEAIRLRSIQIFSLGKEKINIGRLHILQSILNEDSTDSG